ncbi:MAG: hypothetical protein N2044_06490 [Cyclobacteriaceae bacterium]|nr:hypothetical protein [Cyclobacteriaceae bacterium]
MGSFIIRISFCFLLSLSCSFRPHDTNNPQIIGISKIDDEVDVSEFLRPVIKEIETDKPLNITRIRWSENNYLYLANDADKKELLVYDLSIDKLIKQIEFEELKINPVDFSVSYPFLYILSTRDEVHVYDLQKFSLVSSAKLDDNKFTEIETSADGFLFLKKDNLVGIEPGTKVFYRIQILDLNTYRNTNHFDPYVIQNESNTILSNGQSILKQEKTIFYIKPFCDTVFYFNASNGNFQLYKYIDFKNKVNYAKYAHIKNEFERMKMIMENKKYNTGIFFFRENDRFQVFQFIADGQPAFYYHDKISGRKFCTKKINHSLGRNLPFPELITPDLLIGVLNENNLLKNSFEPLDTSLNNLKRKITYEGKNFLFVYYPVQ